MRTLPVPAWEMLLPAQVIPPDKWSAMQNLVYCLIVVGTIVLTLGVVWVIRHFHGDPVISVAAPHQDEIKLIYEETLSAADRVVVRDNQVIEAVRYIPKDPNLVAPLQRWRDARREWAGEMAFLESLGARSLSAWSAPRHSPIHRHRDRKSAPGYGRQFLRPRRPIFPTKPAPNRFPCWFPAQSNKLPNLYGK